MAMALEQALKEAIESSPVPTAALLFESLDGLVHVEIDADRSFHAASTMKLPVMMEAFRQQAAGKLNLSEWVEVYNRFASVWDGSPYSTDPGEDADPAIYEQIGTRLPLLDLVTRMITKSSNLATNIMVDRLGVENIQELMARLGASDMRVFRGVEDYAAYGQGIYNRATPRAMGHLLKVLASGQEFGSGDSHAMLEILSRQEHRQGIPRGILDAKRICHKTGNLDASFHDGAVIEDNGGRSFVLVAFSEGLPHPVCADLVAELARISWNGLLPAP
jgi:beta-lactamase class A